MSSFTLNLSPNSHIQPILRMAAGEILLKYLLWSCPSTLWPPTSLRVSQSPYSSPQSLTMGSPASYLSDHLPSYFPLHSLHTPTMLVSSFKTLNEPGSLWAEKLFFSYFVCLLLDIHRVSSLISFSGRPTYLKMQTPPLILHCPYSALFVIFLQHLAPSNKWCNLLVCYVSSSL